jgi:hypothetical protein
MDLFALGLEIGEDSLTDFSNLSSEGFFCFSDPVFHLRVDIKLHLRLQFLDLALDFFDLIGLLLFLVDENGQINLISSLTVLVGELTPLKLIVQILFLHLFIGLMLSGKRSHLPDLVIIEVLAVLFEQAEETLVNIGAHIDEPLIEPLLSISARPRLLLEISLRHHDVLNLNISSGDARIIDVAAHRSYVLVVRVK